jgi:prevent-host-death family protein
MMTQFNIAEAKAKLSELVDLALQGGEVVIAHSGKPVARIVPVETFTANRANFFGALAHLGPVPDDAVTPEPTDPLYGFEDDSESAMRLVAAPKNRAFQHKE